MVPFSWDVSPETSRFFPCEKPSIQAILGDVAVRSHHDLSNNAKICAHSLIHVGVFENVLDHQVMAITIRKIVLYHENLVASPYMFKQTHTLYYLTVPYRTLYYNTYVQSHVDTYLRSYICIYIHMQLYTYIVIVHI